MEQFIAEHETRLLNAENKYKAADHRHRTLYASIETSTRYLKEDERALLSGLWIFQSLFLPETAADVFAPPDLPEAEAKTQREQIFENLYTLFRRGLLLREVETLSVGNIVLYRNLPTIRLFAHHYLEHTQPSKTLQDQLGRVYASLLQNIFKQIGRSDWAYFLVLHCREDLEACMNWVESAKQGWYANRLGWVLQRVGDRQAGFRWLEMGLTIAQGTDRELEHDILNKMGMVYRATGEPDKALELYEQALSITREVGDRADEGIILNNMGMVYNGTGHPGKALELYEQALLVTRAVGDRLDETTILNNIADVYSVTGQPGKALEIFGQILPVMHEVGDRAGEATILNNMANIYLDF